jgi:hypothetical protein
LEQLNKKVITAMKKYILQGELAINHLGDQDSKDFDNAIYARTEAFHNFVALDNKLQKEYGIDVAQDKTCQELWLKSQQINNQLEQQMAKKKCQLAKKISVFRKSNNAMQGYHGGDTDRLAPKFIRTG